MIKIKKFKENQFPIFTTYDDALKYRDKRAKHFDSKNEYYATNEYKQLYPILQKLYQSAKEEFGLEAEKIMREVGVWYGDKVEYTYLSFMSATEYTGIIIKRNNLPYVKYDSGFVDMTGKKLSRWHKGWVKSR